MTFKIATGIVAALAILGLVGHMDMNSEQLQAAAQTCAGQTIDTTPTYQQCLDNQFENNSDK